MKYIIFFIFYRYVATPCPDQEYYDKIYGKGHYNCLVAHGKYVPEKDTIYFDNEGSADSLYQVMVRHRDAAINSGLGNFAYIMLYPYDSIGIARCNEEKPITFLNLNKNIWQNLK